MAPRESLESLLERCLPVDGAATRDTGSCGATRPFPYRAYHPEEPARVLFPKLRLRRSEQGVGGPVSV